MKIAILLVASAMLLPEAVAPPMPPQQPNATIQEPSDPQPDNCRDRIYRVRDERGLPLLRGELANPDKPLFIAAVDHRIDGCSALVMRNNTNDVRPLPQVDWSKPLLKPAR